MKYIIIISLFVFHSCENKKKDCEKEALKDTIQILGWGVEEIATSDIKLYRYDSLFTKKLDSIPLKEIKYFISEKSVSHGQLRLIFKRNLFSNDNYRLTILDSLQYDIYDIKIQPKIVMIGMKEQNFCSVIEMKINDYFVQPVCSANICCDIKYAKRLK